MNKGRVIRKYKECLSHRQIQYEKALDGVLEGRIPPEYAHERFLKLKEVK